MLSQRWGNAQAVEYEDPTTYRSIMTGSCYSLSQDMTTKVKHVQNILINAIYYRWIVYPGFPPLSYPIILDHRLSFIFFRTWILAMQLIQLAVWASHIFYWIPAAYSLPNIWRTDVWWLNHDIYFWSRRPEALKMYQNCNCCCMDKFCNGLWQSEKRSVSNTPLCLLRCFNNFRAKLRQIFLLSW